MKVARLPQWVDFVAKSRLRRAGQRDSVVLTESRRGRSMMGRLKSDQGQLFYEFHLSDAIPEDHLVRKIDTALDRSWLRGALAPHYSSMGRPSIDQDWLIRCWSGGYAFG